MTAKEITDFLNDLQLGDKGRLGSLRHLAFVVGENEYKAAKNATKDLVVSILSEYYRAHNRVEELWNRLSDAERKIISLHIWGGGFEPAECADEVAEEFGIPVKQDGPYYYWYSGNGLNRFKAKYAEKKATLWLLFPKGSGNGLFHSELRNKVGEMKRVYSNVSDRLVFSTRENRAVDFTNITRFCNSNKLMVTKSGFVSKSPALKLRDYCGYEEFAADMNAKPEDMRTAEGLLVTFPLTVLCTGGGLLSVTEDQCVPGAKAISLINLPHGQLIQKLFDAYLKSKGFNEISIMRGIKPKRGHNPAEARQNLASELKYCQPGQAVYTKEFEHYVRIANKAFARKDESYVVETGNSYYHYGVQWEQYEHPLINIILSFFAALGVIDVVWGEDTGEHVARGKRVPVAFRMNPLGAYVLGLADSYAAPAEPKTNIQGGFTVLPDYTVIVPDSPNRLKHEMYYEKLFAKVSATKEVAIYKLDFGTVVRAIDDGRSVADLREYLSASDKPMPENVARALDDWEEQTGRIRLRQVTILECDDAALLEEVIRYKGMGELTKEKISAAVVVDGNATGKIKKVIEKNMRFCKDVI